MMKKIIMILFLAAAVHTGYAQDSARTKMHARGVEDLKLSDKQSKDLQQINKSYMQSTQDIRKNDALSKEVKTARLQSLQEERNTKIKGVLDAQQYEKYQQNREKMMARGHEGHKPRKDYKRDRSEAAVKELGLSGAQGEQLKSINKEFATKAMELKGLDKAAKKEKIKVLREERAAKLKASLGEEKYKQYDDWQKKAMREGVKGKGEKGKKKQPAAPAVNN